MRLIALVAALTACSPSNWTRHDTILEVAALTATALDGMQTDLITASCREANAVIGQCGENVGPRVYFPFLMLAHMTVAAALPPRARTVWQAAALGAEVNQVWFNHTQGYDIVQWPNARH